MAGVLASLPRRLKIRQYRDYHPGQTLQIATGGDLVIIDFAGGALRPPRVIRRAACLLVAASAVLAAPALGQYPRDAKLAEAKALAGAVVSAFQACVQTKGDGGRCTMPEVAQRAGVSPSGATADGRWLVGPQSAVSVSGGVLTGAVTVSGAPGRDTDQLALALYLTERGPVMRCDTRSTVPPGPAGGQSC